jgi:hypothetical protein
VSKASGRVLGVALAFVGIFVILPWMTRLRESTAAQDRWDNGQAYHGEFVVPGQTITVAKSIEQPPDGDGWAQGCTVGFVTEGDCRAFTLSKYPQEFHLAVLKLDKNGCISPRLSKWVPNLSAITTRKGAYTVTLGTDGQTFRICALQSPNEDDIVLVWGTQLPS